MLLVQMEFFLIHGHSLKRKKINQYLKMLLAIRTILKSTSGLDIDQSKISLMMGKNCHLVIYPINKNKELNFVCILRHKKKILIILKLC